MKLKRASTAVTDNHQMTFDIFYKKTNLNYLAKFLKRTNDFNLHIYRGRSGKAWQLIKNANGTAY